MTATDVYMYRCECGDVGHYASTGDTHTPPELSCPVCDELIADVIPLPRREDA